MKTLMKTKFNKNQNYRKEFAKLQIKNLVFKSLPKNQDERDYFSQLDRILQKLELTAELEKKPVYARYGRNGGYSLSLVKSEYYDTFYGSLFVVKILGENVIIEGYGSPLWEFFGGHYFGTKRLQKLDEMKKIKVYNMLHLRRINSQNQYIKELEIALIKHCGDKVNGVKSETKIKNILKRKRQIK